MLLMSFGFRRAAALLGALSLAFHPAAAAPATKTADVKPQPVVQDYTPSPALWLLQDEDTKIYMFGTVHILPPGFKWRSPAIDTVVREADELVVETYTAPDEEDKAAAAMLPYMALSAPRPILERVPEAHRAALRRQIEASAVPLEAYDMMKSWAAGMMIGLATELRRMGVENPAEAPGVEDALEADFRAAGKPILSIETAEESLGHMSRLSEAKQVELLIHTIVEAEKPEASEGEENHHWARGELAKFDAWFWKDFPEALYEGLLVKRKPPGRCGWPSG